MLEASGLEARVIQPEMDHLNRVLILDRTTRAERRKRALRDAERARERDQAASRGRPHAARAAERQH
jgi:peptide deformylase